MKYLTYWLPAVVAVVIVALLTHAAIVDAWHDLMRDWHLYQIQAIGWTTVLILACLLACVLLTVGLLTRVRRKESV